ncbi:MAG TPA: glycosyltransferase family 39 protein [Verrucomicrobiae bacterium]|nr:glycosyltransferase family 39 protein [Verrucomicrobiae bacterium]
MKPVLLLSGLFFAALIPTLPDLSRYHGDERYYTDAAITMIQSGDYLTPRYADGTERFKKPLLTYWILCASYKVFGITVFSSRLPFLLAGCGVVWLTWRLGQTLFVTTEPALVGALVLAANVQTMTIATRSTPDILLCLFVTASLCGFAELLLRDSRDWRSYALAYLGAGLACATKGLWGLLPLLFALSFWLCRSRHIRISRFAPPQWVLAAAVIGLSWFIVAASKYGRASLQVFLEDQTMVQAEPVKWFLVSNMVEYASATLRHFLPWSLLALVRAPRFKGFAQNNSKALWFALGWYALIFIGFSFGFVRRTRYLLPTYPCVAVVLGAFLSSVKDDVRLRRMSLVFLCLGIVAGALAAILGARLDWRLTIGGLLIAGIGVMLLKAARLSAIGIFTILMFSIAMLSWRPLVEVNPALEIARKLQAFALQPIATLGVPPVIGSQLRLISRGRLNPRQDNSVRSSEVLLVSEAWREEVEAADYQLTPTGFRTKGIRGSDVWRAWRNGRREEIFERNRQNFYIAIPPP